MGCQSDISFVKLGAYIEWLVTSHLTGSFFYSVVHYEGARTEWRQLLRVRSHPWQQFAARKR